MTETGGMAWALLGLCALGAAAHGLGVSPWIAAACVMWLSPVFYPVDLRRPRGLGAWSLWAAWAVLSSIFCAEPLIAAGTWWSWSTGVLLFGLAYSWWGRPHIRAWLSALWGGAAGLGLWSALSGWDAVSAGVLAAALGSVFAVAGGSLPEGGRWRAALKAGRWVFAALALAAAAPQARRVLGERLPYWKVAAAVTALKPATGTGCGLFARGVESLREAPEDAGWSRFWVAGSARSQWLSTAAETGLVGLGLLLCALVFSCPRLAGERIWEKRAAAGAFWGLAAFSLFETVLDSPALLILWFTALACAAPGADEEEARPLHFWPLAGVLGAAACFAGPLPALYAKGSSEGASLTRILRAAALAPGAAGLQAEAGRKLLLENPPRIGEALDRLERASAASPRNALYRYWKGELYGAVGAWPESLREALAAASLEPEFVGAHLLAARASARLGDPEGERRHEGQARRASAAGHAAASVYQARLLEGEGGR